MMTKNQSHEREQLEMLTMDQFVPENHLVRKLESAIDFSFIYPMVEHLYSGFGRPSIDPVVLFKITFVQYIFGIRSMRQTSKEIETNMAYRWFLGFSFYICASCSFLSKCTESKNHQKLIQRHIWEPYLEEAEHLRHTDEIKQIYSKRKETIERVFVDGKEKHGMRWTTLRGLKKLSMQAMLTFASVNLKKLANWTWQAS